MDATQSADGNGAWDQILGTILQAGANVAGSVATNFGREVIYGDDNADKLRELEFEKAYFNQLNGSGAANSATAIRSGSRTLNEYLFGSAARPGQPAQEGHFLAVFIGGLAILFGIIFLLRR